MPKRVKPEDIEHVWHVYESFQGMPQPTKDELIEGVKKLLRMAGVPPSSIAIKFVSGRNRTCWPGTMRLNINLTADYTSNPWRDIVRACAWRKQQCYNLGLELRMARRVCDSHWLLGALKPVVKPKVKLTKEEVRAAKIARLEARLVAWQKKQDRTITAISKINRSLNALRRYQHGNEDQQGCTQDAR